MNPDAAAALARGVCTEFRRRLAEEYVPRIGRCVDQLDEAQIWQRPSPNCNSVGNLLLHLAGNVRQWIQGGLAGQTDQRDRPAEFAASGDGAPGTSDALMAQLTETVAEACAIVDGLTAESLLEERGFQGGRYRETALGAVLHVLEHFSGHAGQIYAWTKQVTGRDLKFYDL